MKMKKKAQNLSESMEIDEENDQIALPSSSSSSSSSDICETLLSRYTKSTAPQHRHLCASAAAMKSIIQQENLPLNPITFFAATISSLNDLADDSLDANSTSALTSLLSILLPLLPSQSLPKGKAGDAVNVLVELLKRPEGGGGGVVGATATIRCVVKCLGSLILLCDLEDWGKVKVSFETVLGFCIDKHPKVRRSAQVCVEKIFRAFPSSVVKEASKVVLSLFKSYMPRATELNAARFVDGSKHEVLSKPEHLEVLHMLNSLKLIAPCLSKKVSLKILCDLYKLLTCQFSPITRHLFNILEVLIESSRADVTVSDAEDIVVSLASYVSCGEKNPMDTVITASSLLKTIMDKLHGGEASLCTRKLPLVFGSIAGLLVFETYRSQAASILTEMINKHIDGSTSLGSEDQVHNDKYMAKAEAKAVKSTCAVFQNILCASDGIPNEHTLAVISNLFFKLGEVSYIFMKDILLILADFMMLEERDATETKHLQECLGSAVMAIGPERMLTLIPVSFDLEKRICSNIWLVPILNKYVNGASLQYFLEHIVPLVESLRQACRKVKKSSLRKDLQALWGLLPAFCRYPTDTHECFEPLAKVLEVSIKEDCCMHANIALALQELVNQNRNILISIQSVSGYLQTSGTYSIEDSNGESRRVPSHYSREVATRNIQALSSCSMNLLQILTDVFFTSPAKNRAHLKEAIGCLASITESSEVKKLFISSLEKFEVTSVGAESDKLEGDGSTITDKELGGNSKKEEQEEAKRSMIMEFAHSLIAGAREDLLEIIFNFIKPTLQANGGVGQSEAYYTLSRIFEEHPWFFSSRFDEVVDLLLGEKSPVDIMTLRSRFSCFQYLFVHMLKSDLEDRNAKAFLILNEIILALKDCNEDPRKAAYDVLLKISDSLNDSSSAASGSPHQELFNMIMGYLSGAAPPIMSAAIAALSLLIYKNNGFCFSVPELFPSVLALLKSKAKEVIKAVLGFVKVIVSSIKTSDLQKLLPDIVNGILPWSSVSRNHFRSKVTTIFEIIIRKCGYASVDLLVPDRYRGFIKSVKEQRQGKTSSKEAKASGSFPERENKRRHGVTTQGEETDPRASSATQMGRINKKGKFNMPSTSKHTMSTGTGKGGQWMNKDKSSHSVRSESRTGDSRKPMKRKDWNKRPFTGRKDNMRQRRN